MLDNLNIYFAVQSVNQINIEAPIFCFSVFDEIELHITENYVMTHAKGIMQMINKMHL